MAQNKSPPNFVWCQCHHSLSPPLRLLSRKKWNGLVFSTCCCCTLTAGSSNKCHVQTCFFKNYHTCTQTRLHIFGHQTASSNPLHQLVFTQTSLLTKHLSTLRPAFAADSSCTNQLFTRVLPAPVFMQTHFIQRAKCIPRNSDSRLAGRI